MAAMLKAANEGQYNFLNEVKIYGERARKLKEIVSSKNPSQLCEIYDEKTGEARAKVTPLIIACFEGDYQTIEFLLNVKLLFFD